MRKANEHNGFGKDKTICCVLALFTNLNQRPSHFFRATWLNYHDARGTNWAAMVQLLFMRKRGRKRTLLTVSEKSVVYEIKFGTT
ncbi:MAG: hypothetical protein U0T84_08120 [Chitinophagales bacterium]